MNGQQSPSAPDPQDKPSSNRAFRSQPVSGLSDKEAFSLLAESMAGSDGRVPDNASPAPDRNGGASGERQSIPVGRSAEGAPMDSSRRVEPPGNASEMPPVVPFRIESTALTGAGRRPAYSMPPPVDARRFDWSTPILVDDQWEVVDGAEGDEIHGRVTEVIDLTQVPPVLIGAGGDAEITVTGSTSETVDPPAERPDDSPAAPAVATRILPPNEEAQDARPLPPLVFLNTRGDILPRVGERANGGNGDRFDYTVAAWDGDEPPVATTTNAGGVENMADPRGDIEADADTGDAVGTPDSLVGPSVFDQPSGPIGSGVIDEVDSRIPDPVPSLETPMAPLDDTAAVSFGPGSLHDPAPPIPASSEQDPRLEDLQRIFDQYSGPVIAVIASIAAERRAVDEALQSTFEAVWKTLDTFDPDQPRGPWMFTLARRQAAEQVEQARRIEQESTPRRYPVPSHRHDEAIAVDKSWEAWEVRLAVDQLSQAEHDVLRLIHNEGLIHPEIAAQLHTTVGAVKSHAYSGSHRLVELLDHVIRPDAIDGLTVDQASALTWYLAGVADGSDLDPDERSAVKRVQAQLASATAWINPDPHARERVISFGRRTLDDPGPLSGTSTDGHHLDFDRLAAASSLSGAVPEGSRAGARRRSVPPSGSSNRRPWILVGLAVVGLIGVIATWSLFSGSTDAEVDQVRRYQLQATELDGDASGVVEIVPASTGSLYEFEFGGLDATTDEFFYAAWLQSTAGGGVVPLGTFSWRASGDPLVLSGPAWSDAYDLLVVTRSETMTRATIDDPAVLSVSIE